jgi:hypothetical protein
VARDSAFGGLKAGLLRDFHCLISNVSGAISRPRLKYLLMVPADVKFFTLADIKMEQSATLQSRET